RLTRNLAMQLGDVLFGAAEPATEEEVTGVVPTAPAEHALLARLRESAFVEYQLPEGADGDVVRLPRSALRGGLVGGADASVAVGDVLVPVLRELTSDGRMPVGAVQPTVVAGDDVDGGLQPNLVTAIRGDESLRDRLSTVDNLDNVSGRAATV